jgi:hypothetical protein
MVNSIKRSTKMASCLDAPRLAAKMDALAVSITSAHLGAINVRSARIKYEAKDLLPN